MDKSRGLALAISVHRRSVVTLRPGLVDLLPRRDLNPHRHGCNRESCHAALSLSYGVSVWTLTKLSLTLWCQY